MANRRVQWGQIKPENTPPFNCPKCKGDGRHPDHYDDVTYTVYCTCPAGRRLQKEAKKNTSGSCYDR